MASRYKDKDGGVVMSFNGTWVSWSHTIVAYGMWAIADPPACFRSREHMETRPVSTVDCRLSRDCVSPAQPYRVAY